MRGFNKLLTLYILLTFSFIQIITGVYGKAKLNPERGYEVYDKLNQARLTSKTVLSKLTLLEKEMKSITSPDKKAEMLYKSAEYKIFLGYEYKDSDYVKKHASDYVYSEPGDLYTYKGGDLRQIVDKFYKTPIADEAGYLLATLPTPGECEGDVSCTLARELYGFEPFFKKFPNSPYIYNGINDINKSFSYFIEDLNSSFYDDTQRQAFVSSLNTYLKMLLNSSNYATPVGLMLTAKAYIKSNNNDKAKEVLNIIISKYPRFSKLNEAKTLLNGLK